MLACGKHEGSYINTIIQLQHKLNRLKSMHLVKMLFERLLWSSWDHVQVSMLL